jgi:hypothetical protein
MGSGGYVKKSHDGNGPVPPIDGFAISSNPPEFIDALNFDTKDAENNGQSQGDAPAFSMPPFADGKDLRNRG